jgi:hypothetical protein
MKKKLIVGVSVILLCLLVSILFVSGFRAGSRSAQSKGTISFEMRVGEKSSFSSPYAVTAIQGAENEKQSVRFANGESLADFGYNVSYIREREGSHRFLSG